MDRKSERWTESPPSNHHFLDSIHLVFFVGAGEADVVAGVAGNGAVFFAGFPQHTLAYTSVCLYELGVEARGQFFQAGDTGSFHLGRYLALHYGGRGAGAFGIGEDVDESGLYLLQEIIAFAEEFLVFAGEACHNIDSEKHQGLARPFHSVADVFYFLLKFGCCVFASHGGEKFIAADLQGNVEMGLEFGAGSYPVYNVVCKKIGLYAGDAVALDAINAIEGLEKVKERFSRASAEVARVHPCKNDFFYAFGGNFLRIFYGLADGDVAAASAGIGHDAVAAEIVAAVLHFKERARPLA